MVQFTNYNLRRDDSQVNLSQGWKKLDNLTRKNTYVPLRALTIILKVRLRSEFHTRTRLDHGLA